MPQTKTVFQSHFPHQELSIMERKTKRKEAVSKEGQLTMLIHLYGVEGAEMGKSMRKKASEEKDLNKKSYAEKVFTSSGRTEIYEDD